MKNILMVGLFMTLLLSTVQTSYADGEIPLKETEDYPSEITERYPNQELDVEETIFFISEEIEPSLGSVINLNSIIFVVMIIGTMLSSILINLVLAFVCKLNTKKALLHVLFINLITHGLSYIFYIQVVQLNLSNFTTIILLFEFTIMAVKFGYLFWRLHPRFTWKQIALYLLIAQVVSYLLAIR